MLADDFRKALADEAEVVLRGETDAVRFSDPEIRGVVLLSRKKYDELIGLPGVRRKEQEANNGD